MDAEECLVGIMHNRNFGNRKSGIGKTGVNPDHTYQGGLA